MFCKYCGRNLKSTDKFCPDCGMQIDNLHDGESVKIVEMEVINNNSIFNKKALSKKKIGALFVIEVLIIFVGIFICFMGLADTGESLVTGSITSTDFVTVMQNAGYEIVDMTYDYVDYSSVGKYFVASKNNYQIEFVSLNNNYNVSLMYDNMVDKINSNKVGVSSYVNNELSDEFKSYALTSNGIYYETIMKNNTLIYCAVPVEYKSEVIDILYDMGYQYKLSSKITIGLCLMLLPMIIMSFIMYYITFKKAGKKGYKALIPFYNLYVMCEIAFGKGKGWFAIFMLIPMVNMIFFLILLFKYAKVFGKSDSFAVLSVLFTYFAVQIIAFDDSKYILN